MAPSIALITSSTRHPRLNPFITRYVHDLLAPVTPANASLHIVDLADQHLPLYDEPEIPSYLPDADPTSFYRHEHTRAWSATVRRFDAFIFVTPQYNWSVPASLKNALDYLFHEWKGKPAAIVSYGGRGGGKAADHLRQILEGLRMRPVLTMAALVTNRHILEECGRLGRIGEGQVERWADEGVEEAVRKLFEELVGSS